MKQILKTKPNSILQAQLKQNQMNKSNKKIKNNCP